MSYASAGTYFKAASTPYDANMLRPTNFLKAQLKQIDVRSKVQPAPAPAQAPAPVAPTSPDSPLPNQVPETEPPSGTVEYYPPSEVPRIGYPNPQKPMHGFKENGVPKAGHPNPQKPMHGYRENLTLEWKTAKYANTKDPEVFGPPLWLTLHNAAAHYPDRASPIMADQMMGFIKGLPAVLPCASCKEHATAHIQANLERLPEICSGRDKLEQFFVDFHNKVNKRYGKPFFSIEQARKMYRGGVDIRVMKY